MGDRDRLWLSDRQVDLVTGDVVRAGETVARLTTKERELLGYLAARTGEDVARGDLLTDVWGYAPTARTRAVDFTVRRLRQKIEAEPSDPEHVQTVHGVGYRFQPTQAPEQDPLPQGLSSINLPTAAVEPEGPVHGAVALVQAALRSRVRLVTVVTPLATLGRQVARHVAASFGDGVLWLRGGLSALSQILPDASHPAARRLLLRTRPPSLVVLEDVPVDDLEAMDELARALRAAPDLRVLAVSPRRLALAAEHSLALEPTSDTPVDLTELDEAWAAIPPELRTGWSRLSACTGSVDLEGAEHLLGAEAVDHLDALQDAGVLAADASDGRIRFRLRQAARRYGRQRLGQELATLRQQRRAWLLERYAPLLTGLAREVPAELLAEAPELHALWTDERARPVARVRAALLLSAAGHAPEHDRDRLEAAGTLLDATDQARLPLHLLRSRLRLAAGSATDALLDAREALRQARADGRLHGEALAGALLANALLRLGRLTEALEAAQQARQRLQVAGDRLSEIALLQVMADVEHELGQRARAESTLREAVHLARLDGASLPLADGLISLGTLHRHKRDVSSAAQAYDTARDVLSGRTGVEAELSRARLSLESAVLDLERGATRQALGVLEPLARDLGSHGRTRFAGEAWLAVAGSRWQGGDLDGAVEGFEQGRSAFETSEDRLYTGLSLAWSGATAAAAGEVGVASGWLEESREHLEPLGLRRGREVLTACRAHLDRAQGRELGPVLAWARDVESSDESWGDVRLALRLLERV